jgi:hypothetical protein
VIRAQRVLDDARGRGSELGARTALVLAEQEQSGVEHGESPGVTGGLEDGERLFGEGTLSRSRALGIDQELVVALLQSESELGVPSAGSRLAPGSRRQGGKRALGVAALETSPAEVDLEAG